MTKQSFSILAGLFVVFFSATARAETFMIFKAAVAVPVEYVVIGMEVDRLVKKNITSKEIINLTLGRPIDTKIDAATEILAFQITYEESTNQGMPTGPLSKLIIWDPTATGLARIKATVATVTTLDFDIAYGTSGIKGQGIAEGTIPEGTADPTGSNKFFATTLKGAAHASNGYIRDPLALPAAASGSLSGLFGRVRFKYTDKNNPAPIEVNGFALKGTAKATGKALAFIDL